MKLTFKTEPLRSALKTLKGIIPLTTSNHYTQCYLFQIEDGVAKITATSLDTTMSIKINYDSDDQSERTFLMEASLINKILGTLKDKTVTINLDDDMKNCDIITKKGNLGFVMEDPDIFPQIDYSEFAGKERLVVGTKDFTDTLNQARSFQGKDESRPQLQSAYYKTDGNNMWIYATDGHSMYRRRISLVETPKEKHSTLMPKSATALIKSVSTDDTITIIESEKKILVLNKTIALVFLKLEFPFPDCDRVIPALSENICETSTEDFLDTVKQAVVLTSSEMKTIKIRNEKGSVFMSVDDFTMGRNAEVQLDGSLIKKNTFEEGFQIGFYAPILETVVGVVSTPSVAMHVIDDRKAVVFNPVNEEGVYDTDTSILLMPVML